MDRIYCLITHGGQLAASPPPGLETGRVFSYSNLYTSNATQ